MDDHDHRSLAVSLDLYHLEEEAPGMVFWHPRGYRIYRVLEDFIRSRMRRLGYREVRTPQLLPRALWERSGHWEKFSEQMFVVPREDGRDLALKPMSCPCHVQIFNDKLRSWRDLPMRLAEFGQCHRDEPSGSMHGFMRSRGFEQDDAHVLCRPDQIASEVARFVRLLKEVYASLGFSKIDVGLSLRPARRAGSDAQWDWAEAELLRAARAAGLEPRMMPGEGAFYGPKLEFALRDRQGRSWQCGTAQLDSVLPDRLGARYIDENGQKAVPMMIHHAVFGSLGRFIGILLEEHEGALPAWLSPDQVAILPVSERHMERALEIEEACEEIGLRALVLDGNETLSRRIVSARELRIPMVAVVGDREVAQGTLALRCGQRRSSLGLDEALREMRSVAAPPPRADLR